MFARDPLDEDAGFFWPPCRGNMRVQPPLTVKVATNARPGFIDSASLALVTVLAQQVGCFLKPISVDREYAAANRAGAALPPAQDYRLPIFSDVCHSEDQGHIQSMHVLKSVPRADFEANRHTKVGERFDCRFIFQKNGYARMHNPPALDAVRKRQRIACRRRCCCISCRSRRNSAIASAVCDARRLRSSSANSAAFIS
jgi:hypothetical protein